MADVGNVNAPFGFKPVGTLSGAPVNGKLLKCYIPSTDSTAAFFIGDPVVFAGSADANGVPTVTLATAGAGYPVLGVIVGFETDATYSTIYRADDTARYCWVNIDPMTIYEVQCDGTFAATMVGANAVFASGSGSTTTGLSAYTLYITTTPTAAATYQMLILGVARRPDNAIGDYTVVEVVFSLHTLNAVYQVDTGGSAAYAGQKGA